jgi:hypothetical protein
MILDLLDGDAPSAHRVALRAIRAQLALVDIRVAVLAFVAHVVEHHLYVASCAGYTDVHPAQRIRGLIMIELRNGPDGLPTLCRVAILAREVETTVRTL